MIEPMHPGRASCRSHPAARRVPTDATDATDATDVAGATDATGVARAAAVTPAFAMAFAAALTLTACASPAPVRFHTLVAPAVPSAAGTGPAAGAQPAPFLIDVLPVGIPAQLDQPQLIVRQGDSDILMPESERWAAPLADEFREALSAELSRRLVTRDVAGLARPPGYPVIRIKVQVRRFDAWLGQRVELDADWSLEPTADAADTAHAANTADTAGAMDAAGAATPVRSARLVCGGRFGMPSPGGYPELVRARQQLIARLAARIATEARDRSADPDAGCARPVSP